MITTLEARLDRRSQVLLDRLVRCTGWSASRVVREGVKLLTARYRLSPTKQVIGLGRFASGLSDQGSNKKHLKSIGRQSSRS
jgi:hypothetical protein